MTRRGRATAAFDRLIKYFTMTNMPLVPSQYWNFAYGEAPGEVTKDEEGMQTMRVLARNMAWILKGLEGKEKPELEPHIFKTLYVK